MTDILGIGSSGLTAYRKLLETTGNNIANANTEGYVRRDVVLQSVGEAQMLPTARLASSGSGVSVSLIRRASDAFLQAQMRAATARQAQSEVVSDGLVRIEKAVIAPANTVGTAVQDFYAKAQDLSVSPASTTARLALIDAGQRVAESFRAAATSVTSEIASADTSLKSSIEAVNSLATQIARLNLDISRTGKGQQKLNDLLDQRDVLLNDLSKLVNFTIVEEESGSVDVYLGDTASGPRLVELGTSRMLGSTKDGEKTELIFDPYGNANVTNQVTGGTIAGLIEFQKTARGFLENIDQLATGFTAAINTQHRQGLDLNGRQGANMFSAEGLEAVAFAANRGKAKIDISIDGATKINSAAYEAKYSAQAGTWTLKSQSTGASVTGKMPLTLEGVTFSSEGMPEDGDTFSVEPLKNASAAMRFVLSDPASIAAAQSIYVDPSQNNAGKGTLSIERSDVSGAAPSIPSMLDLFKPQGSDALSFRSDGVAFAIPAGAKSIALSSTGFPASITFETSAVDIARIANGNQVEFSIEVNGVQKKASLDLNKPSLDDIANLINNAAALNDFGRQVVFASAASGKIVITASNGYSISNGQFVGREDPQTKPLTINGTSQSAIVASKLALFTREGVQISGDEAFFNDAQITKLINVSNGFLPTAQYRYRSSEIGQSYRNLPISTTNTSLVSTTPSDIAGSVLSFSVSGDPSVESTAIASRGVVSQAATYAVSLKGMPEVSVTSIETAGLSSDGVAGTLIDAMNSHAPSLSWAGSPINFSLITEKLLTFQAKIDDKNYTVNFKRAFDPETNAPLTTGTFEILDGPEDIQIQLANTKVTDGPPAVWEQRVIVSVPKKIGSQDIKFDVIPSDATRKLALTNGLASLVNVQITGAGTVDASEFKAGTYLDFMINGERRTINVKQQPDSWTGTIGSETIELRWSLTDDNRLKITSNAKTLEIAPSSAQQRDNAFKIGFYGTDLSINKTKGLFAQEEFLASAINGTNLTVNINGTDHVVRIANEVGSINVDNDGNSIPAISWTVVDKRLVLTSNSESIRVVMQSDDQVAAASKLGFVNSTDAAVGVSTRLRIASSINDDNGSLGNVDGSSSLTGTRIVLSEVPEDLIVVIVPESNLTTARTISVRYPVETERSPPKAPDFSVVIEPNDVLSIVRLAPDGSVAEIYARRSWTPREPIEWLGMQFSIDGAVEVGDIFYITQGEERSGDNRNALALAKLQASDIFGKNQGTFQDVYASVSTKLGTTSQSAANDATTAKDAATNLQLAFDGKTGVDLDREASDLIRYQQAYQAAAQVVKSAREMFDTILRIF